MEEEEAATKKKVKDTASDEEFVSDDDNNDFMLPVPLSERDKRKKKLRKDQQRKEDKEFRDEENDEIEIVPKRNLEDYDLDELVTTRVLAQSMLRLKDRDQIIEDSYNRYSKPDNEDAPEWFAEDERKHNMKYIPISKEEFQAEKRRLLLLNSKSIKKIAEAKFRKQMRLGKKLVKTKQKAKSLMDQEGMTEAHKLRQVQNLYKKEMSTMKKDKKYTVGRRFKADKQKTLKSGKFQKVVDKRLKKDKRGRGAERQQLDVRGKKIKKSKKRQVRRR